jgi:hypothetical protein
MKNLFTSLVKAQKEFGPALKSSTNPHFKSRYADLSACVEAVIDGLNNNGIMLMQTTHPCEDGVMVETLFLHESGEQLSSGKLHVPASKHDAQGYGSALTYARRYSLMAACGIAPTDDDGHAATGNVSKPVEQAKKPPPAKIEGKGGTWNLVISADKGADIGTWIDVVYDLTSKALGLAKNDADVMEIFKVNRNVFDQLKLANEDSYKNLMACFTETKNNFKKA